MVFPEPDPAHAHVPRQALYSPPRTPVHSWVCQVACQPWHQDVGEDVTGGFLSEGQGRVWAWGSELREQHSVNPKFVYCRGLSPAGL